MKGNVLIPWRKIIASSVMTLFLIFILGFFNALLCSSYFITITTARMLMFVVVFLAAFSSLFIVKTKDKNILYTVLSVFISFVMLIILGMFVGYAFNGKYTIWIFATLCMAAILNSIIKASI